VQSADADAQWATTAVKALEDKKQQYLPLLLDRLKDPGSAQTRNLRIVKGKGGEALSGDVNAKDAFGGYVGSKPFAVAENEIQDARGRVYILNTDVDFDRDFAKWLSEFNNQSA